MPAFIDIGAIAAAFVPPEPGRPEATLALGSGGRTHHVYRLHPDGASIEPVEADGMYDCPVDGSPFALLLWLAGRAGSEEVGLTISGPRPEVGRTFRP